MKAIEVLLTSLVDYAGLFPPARLEMGTTVRNYASYVKSEHNWMLGRLVVPVARLDEFESAAAELLPKEPGAEPWRLSALLGESPEPEIERIFAFNSRHDEGDAGVRSGAAVIDTVEMKVSDAAAVDAALKIIPEQLEPFFEVAWDGEIRGTITAIAGTGACAKIRTGGVTPDAIPPARAVAQFITTCSAADVRFKATAGLHHPMRAQHALTYEPDAPKGVMHGFLNVFLAAAFVRAGRASEDDAVKVLQEVDPGAFRFTEHGVRWGELVLDTTRLAHVRESFAISFGSCSFEEPVADLRKLGLL